MRSLLLMMIAASGPCIAADADIRFIPAKSMLKELEARVRLPAGEGTLTSYSRYYVGEIRGGLRKIVGIYQRGGRNFHMHVLELDESLPALLAEGCEILFDVESRKVERTTCNSGAP